MAESKTLAFPRLQGYRARSVRSKAAMSWARVILVGGVVAMMPSPPVAVGEEDWALFRETVIPREDRLVIKYPLFTLRKTRRDCLRRLYAELSDALLRSLPPDGRDGQVEGIEAKQARPAVWVYRLLGSRGTTLYELRLSCLPDATEPREKAE